MGSIAPNDTPQKLKIVIAGGGISGLALAAGLCKNKPNLDVHIYEAVPAHKDVGAGLALHLNAIKAMALIGPEVKQAYLEKATTNARDAETILSTKVILAQGPHTGELVAELGKAKGRKSVSRADLLAGFLELVPRDRITFGKKLARIWETETPENKKVSVEFQDGTQLHQIDCLIGADGIHSVVRAHLLGEDHPATHPKNHDRWQVYRTLVTTEEAVTLHDINPEWTRTVPVLLGPRGHVNCIPLNKGTRLSAGVAVRGAALTAADDKDSVGGGGSGNTGSLDPSLYSDYSQEAQRIVQMVARDTSASWSVGDHDHAPFYAKGNIAMMGDAAHASLPFAGNGAAQALEDAAVLNHLFASVDEKRGEAAGVEAAKGGDSLHSVHHVEAALAAYDTVRRPRSQAVVDMARRFGRVYAYAEEDSDGKKLHEDPARLKAFFASAAAFTNEADLKKQNDDAMDLFERAIRARSL